jgi:hypothetical protein
MAEQPPLNRSYVISYAANDRDFPTIGLRADPRVAGYRVPEDLSPHPDSKRYPNHVFTGSQPSNGDERVTHIYEILPAPYVPFTRYDDDLGPIQGRRRSVKNEGQVARLGPNQRVNYEAREGSAIVYTEIEEEWSIDTDEDGNSLFPLKDRDFYDPSRGAVQERRQLFVPTGGEEGTLENVNGVITQTSYEPYNEFLSVKIVQTYKVDGPQLIGRATDNDGQLVTVTTQRKGADGYIPPNPTATRTVEVNREDAESLVERIVDTPSIFTAKTFQVERPDPIPQKFRVAVPIRSNQEIVVGQAQLRSLSFGQISISEEQRNNFLKRVSTTSRDQAVLPQTLIQKATDNDRQTVTLTETLQLGDTSEAPTATKTIESEALGDGNFVVRKTEIPEVFAAKTFQKTKDDLTPQKFRGAQESDTIEESVAGIAESPTLSSGEFSKSEQQVNKFVKRVSTTSRAITQSVTLLESILTPEGQIGSRTLTLASGVQTFDPSALLIDANVENLGDGRTVKTETTVPKVFAGQIFSAERPDPLPQKFKVAVQTLATQQTLEGEVDPSIDLLSGQISKSEQQVTEFVKRVSITSRDQNQLPVTLVQKATDNDKQVVTVTQTLGSADTIEPPTATKNIESEALGDGNYVITKTEIPEVFAGRVFQKTKDDLTPQKFRGAQESNTLEEAVIGEAVEPTLGSGEFSKSEQQVNKFVKRVSTTSRAITQSATLLERVLTPQGQIGTRILTLADGEQTFDPSATLIDATVEALGDGRTVKTETTVPLVFPNKTIRKTKPDLTPEKFRAAQQDTITEESVAGEVNENISLGAGEFSKSEEQVTQFIKRISTNTRDISAATDLTETIVTQQGQIAIRTLRLSAEAQSIQPDARLIDGSIEALGDGRTIKTEVRVGEIFDNKTRTVSKPDVLPERFRASTETKTEQEVIASNSIADLSLGEGELEKTEERLTEFRVRKSTTKREDSDIPELDGISYEEAFDIQIPYTEKITTNIPSGSSEATPIDNNRYLVTEYDPDQIASYLNGFFQSYPTTINMNLPRVLESVIITWDEKNQEGSYDNIPSAGGTLYQFANTDKGEASSFSSATPIVNLNFKDVWGQNIPAEVNIFFLKNPVTKQQILSKLGVLEWPTFKPKSHLITGKGVEVRASVSVAASISIQQPKPSVFGGYTDRSRQREFSRSITPVSINIPPCLHGSININQTRNVSANISATASTAGAGSFGGVSSTQSALITDTAYVTANLGSTSPTSIPSSGRYLIDSNVDFFKYGFSIVRATIINASVFA